MASSQIVDDKSDICIPFLLEAISARNSRYDQAKPPPFFLGINGIQGAGKTTLVSVLKRTLSQVPHSLSTVVISLDDFYLRHEDQVKLAASHPRNPLVQHRGQPSTHDLDLLMSTLSSLQKREPVKLPQYDKSAFKGAGDRSSSAVWEEVNRPSEDTIEVVILEGWCTAFRALTSSQLQQKWQAAKDAIASGTVDGQLGRIQLEDAAFVNEALKAYEQVWILSDALIHIDAQDTRWVYDWRLEAEVKLRAEKGSGMTDQQVKHFIDGYYPAYELYADQLRNGVFTDAGRQLRLVLNRSRRLVHVEKR